MRCFRHINGAAVEPPTSNRTGLDMAGILSRIDTCSPEAIKLWLEAKGFKLVSLSPNAGGQAIAGPPLEMQNHGQRVNPAIGEPQTRPSPVVNTIQQDIRGRQPESTTATQRKRPRTGVVETVDLTTDDPTDLAEQPVANSTVKFNNQGIEAHGLVALSKYFAAKMTALDAYIPLSVFNTQWLRQDLLQQSLRKRSVKEKLEDTYIGLTVPLEWKMTFGEWVVAFDLFITYLEYYKWDELSLKFKSHKENVFAVKRENSNWPVAFRYDLAVRTAVMTFRLPDGSVANPAIRDARIEREAIRETERLKDFLPAFKEINPYADGEVKAFIDPITGVDSRTNQPNGQRQQGQGFNKPTNRSQSFSQQYSFNNLPIYDGPGGSSSPVWDDRRIESQPNRFRNRRGSWNGAQGTRDRPFQRRRFHGGSENERRDDWRDDSRGGEREVVDGPGKTK